MFISLISLKDIFIGLVHVFLATWQLWLLIGVAAIIKLAFKLWGKQRLSISGVNEIDRMDGLTFEKYLEVLFDKRYSFPLNKWHI